MSALDELCVNTLRFLAVDAVEKAMSGHPGLPMGAAPMGYVLWTRHRVHNPADPTWFDRDRFVLSAGHGSMLLYGLLHLTGYDLPLDELQRFRQWGSRTPGHPERNLTPGIEVTTGPLGQGFGNAVGEAIAEAHLGARFNRPGLEVIRHFTYGLLSDGDLMEGVSSEAASLAGHLQLGRLILLYDDNQISLGASTRLTFTEDPVRRFEAYGWHALTVSDGNDLAAIDAAIGAAKAETSRPSLIRVRTHIGYGAPHKQDTHEAHGSPLGAEEVREAKKRLGWPLEPTFLVPEEARAVFLEAKERGARAEAEWKQRLAAYRREDPDLGAELDRVMHSKLPPGYDKRLPRFDPSAGPLATRVASGKVLTALGESLPELFGGSADLEPSTHTLLEGKGDFQAPIAEPGEIDGAAGGGFGYAGRNLRFGVREHAMGTIVNGLAAHGGVIPYAATFLAFSDYMRPPIRLAALMRLRSVFVFTHDSIGLGEDGPTHQPVEQLASLRAVPDLLVIRPCDANETTVAWKVAIESFERPVALVLTRQKVPTLDRKKLGSEEGLRRGGYVLAEASGGAPRLLLIATGSEVALTLEAREELTRRGVPTRVVSLPCFELFESQPKAYRDEVLPPSVRARLSVEAGSPFGWRRWVGDEGAVLGVDRFGASAPSRVVMREYGFTPEEVVRRALGVLEDAPGSR
ncbi:MAG: transketolase [Myxococcaceae bacterium]